MLAPPKSSSAVVVMISSKSVSIGNHSRAIDLLTVAEIALLKGLPKLRNKTDAVARPMSISSDFL